MSRLRDAFDALIAEHPPGDPDDVLAAARAEAAGGLRSHRRAVSGLVAAAVVVLLGLAAVVIVTRDDGTDDVRSGPTTTVTSLTTTTTTPRPVEVAIHLRNGTGAGCTTTEGVPRTVYGDDPIRRTFEELVSDGPTLDEGRRGLTSWFWWETEGSVRSVRVEDGVAHVDFTDLRPYLQNVSTACGSASLMAQLDHTASQFPEVERTVYSLEGDVDAFYSWLGLVPPEGHRPPAGLLPPVTAVSSSNGVTVTDRTGAGTTITTDPARVAFAAGGFVAFQGDDPGDLTLPRDGGPIRVWQDGEVRTLAVDPNTTSATLLDTAVVGNRALVLVSERTGDTPDTSWDDLVAIDLATGERRTIAHLNGWESETVQAELLPDGSVIRLGSGEGQNNLSLWREGEPDFVWSQPVDGSSAPTLAVAPDGATAITLAPIEGARQVLRTVRHDLGTGEPEPMVEIELDGSFPEPVWCQDWLAAAELSCSRVDEDPVAVLLDGTVRPLPTEPGARITVSG